jgi:hypothetical protein
MEEEIDLGDLRFIELHWELSAVEKHIELLQRTLPDIIKRECSLILEGGFDSDNEVDSQIVGGLISEWETGFVTRHLTGGVLIAISASYESAIRTLALEVENFRKVPHYDLSPKKEFSGSFPERARQYFETVLGVSLHPVETDWERLAQLYTLRNVMAHENGFLPQARKKQREQIEKWANSTPGLTIEQDYLVISLQFSSEMHQFIKTLLEELITCVKAYS